MVCAPVSSIGIGMVMVRSSLDWPLPPDCCGRRFEREQLDYFRWRSSRSGDLLSPYASLSPFQCVRMVWNVRMAAIWWGAVFSQSSRLPFLKNNPMWNNNDTTWRTMGIIQLSVVWDRISNQNKNSEFESETQSECDQKDKIFIKITSWNTSYNYWGTFWIKQKKGEGKKRKRAKKNPFETNKWENSIEFQWICKANVS